jgi:hypothetical protein
VHADGYIGDKAGRMVLHEGTFAPSGVVSRHENERAVGLDAEFFIFDCFSLFSQPSVSVFYGVGKHSSCPRRALRIDSEP